MPKDQPYFEVEQKHLNHDYKDYRMTLILKIKIIHAIQHGNQVNLNHDWKSCKSKRSIMVIRLIKQIMVKTMNLAEQKIAQALKSGATKLNLSGMGLTELPPKLWELKNLTVLNLGGAPSGERNYLSLVPRPPRHGKLPTN